MLTNFSNSRASVKKADVHHGRATWGHFFLSFGARHQPFRTGQKGN